MTVPRVRVGDTELEDLLGDADPGVRLRAALEVGESRRRAVAPALVARFGLERDFQIREALTWSALRTEGESLPLVLGLLHDPRWLARLQAVHTLSKLGRFDDGPTLSALVGDPVDAVAARAYGAAARTGNPVTVPALVAELSRGDSTHRNALTAALATFGRDAVPALVAALGHRAPAVRRHAADTLGLVASPAADRAVPALAEAVRDPEREVRLAALNALGQLEVPSAWWVVDEASRAPDPAVRLLGARLTERRPTGPRFEPLVTCSGGPVADELVPALALQVRVGRPRYLSRDDVPASDLASVREQAHGRARREGRSESAAARVAAGRVEQYVHDTVLLEQVSVAEPTVLVKDLLYGTGVRITGFARLDAPATT